MGTIIPLHDVAHEKAQQLLPWYVNGTLAESERAEIEAHLATCDECRDDLATERAIGTRVTSAGPDVERGWAAMQARMRAARERRDRWYQRRVPLAWAVGAQAVAAVLLVVLVVPLREPAQPAAPYHALGADKPAAAEGNLLVMFAQGSSERDLRGALQHSGARIVDGPTVAGAYVLHVPGPDRNRALERLRSEANVTLAEPIDAPEAK